jgi:hypothetical protein
MPHPVFDNPFFIATMRAQEKALCELGLPGPLSLNYLVTMQLYNGVWRHYRRGDNMRVIIELKLNELKIENDDQREAYAIAFGMAQAAFARARKAERVRKLTEFERAHPDVPIEVYEQEM